MKRITFLVLAACGAPPASAPATASDAPRDHQAEDAHEHGGQHGGGMHHGFTDAERWAKVFDDPGREAWQKPDRVVAALALTPKLVVADVGAGTGYFAVRLARAVPEGRVLATDIEPDMVRYLKERAEREGLANVEPVLSEPNDAKLPAESVDRVLVVDVWHHLGDRVAYAKQLAAALRPGGRVVIVDFKLDAKQGPPREHRLPPEAIEADLRAVGLEAETAPDELPDQYIVVGRRR